MEITAPVRVRCEMGEIVGERRDRMGTTKQAMGWEKVGAGTRRVTAGW